MHLYHLTLQRPGAINCAVYGSFSAPKKHEFAVARGHVLELLRPDEAGRLQVVCSTEVFGLIRSILRYRLHGQEWDHLLVSSDSGRMTVLRFDESAAPPAWSVVQRETYGKTGCRRVTPGQFLAADPTGRAFLLGAIEKQKFVYQTNREEDLLTIASPLEAHRGGAICFDVVGLDAGFGNPCFAALEIEYGDADSDPSGEAAAAAAKQLVTYELDLGVNTVARRAARETDRGANALLAVPGRDAGASSIYGAGVDGPGGTLVLAENWVLYEPPAPGVGTAGAGAGAGAAAHPPALRVPIPRRADMPDEKGLLITASCMMKTKKAGIFALLQSELGDLYKATFATDPATGAVTDVAVQYFDTIPPAIALCITRNGLLFAASEFGAHTLYRIDGLGEGQAVATAHALKLDLAAAAAGAGEDGAALEVECPVFTPRPLTNLTKMDALPSLAPLIDFKIVVPPATAAAAASAAAAAGGGAGAAPTAASIAAAVAGGAGAPYIAALSGRGPRSCLRLLREGLPVGELTSSPLPGEPLAIYTVRDGGPSSATYAGAAGGGDGAAGAGGAAVDDTAAGAGGGAGAGGSSTSVSAHDRYIVISFANATLALSVAEGEEVSSKESGLLDGAPTLALSLLASGALLQAHPGGMRLITGTGAARRVAEWRAPGKRTVTAATANARQAVLALSGGELVYFELDSHGRLEEAGRKAAGAAAEVTALALGPVPHGRTRAPFVAIADSASTVRILGTDPAAPLAQMAAQALRAPASALSIAYLLGSGASSSGVAGAAGGAGAGAPASSAAAPSSTAVPHLFIGLSSGVLTRVALDPSSGALSDPRTRFLGPKPVRLAPLALGGVPAVLALSSRPWATYPHNGKLVVSPLSYGALSGAAPLASEQLPSGGGIVAISGESLRVLTVSRLGEAFHATELPLRYTPRRMALHPAPSAPTVAMPHGQQLAVIIESDANVVGIAAAAAVAAAAEAAATAAAGGGVAPPPPPPPPAPLAPAVDEDAMDADDDAMDADDADAGAGAGSSSSAVVAGAGAGSTGSAGSAAGAASAASGSAGPGPGPAGSGSSVSDVAYAIAKPSIATPGETVTGPPGGASDDTGPIADAEADPQAVGVDWRRVGASPPAGAGAWGSAIRVVDLAALSAVGDAATGGSGAGAAVAADGTVRVLSTHHAATHHLVELEGDEAAVSLAVLPFAGHGETVFVVVGTVTRMTWHPRTHAAASLRTYRLVRMGDVPVDATGKEVPAGHPTAVGVRAASRLQFLHRTPVEELPASLAGFNGRLLAGIGRNLRLYDLGKRRLLRKAEARGAVPTLITAIAPAPAAVSHGGGGGDRIWVADASESAHLFRFRRADASFALIADDTTARHVAPGGLLPLDADTVALGDRFGNVSVLRLPADADEEGADDPTGSRLLWGAGAGAGAGGVGGAPNKLVQVAQFYAGGAVTSLAKGSLAGGAEVLLYGSVHGGLGALAPFTSREDLDLASHLELFMRHEAVSLIGRDHLSYRSYFIPVKDVVDGDLCEAFASLPPSRQKALAADLERTPLDVTKKLEDTRSRIL